MVTAKNASLLNRDGNGAPFEEIKRSLADGNLQEGSRESMGGIYQYAYDLYRQGRLDDAEVVFRYLCIYDFYNADYAMGFATVCHLKKDYLKAIDLYALAFALSKNDYRPMFYAGQCQWMRGQAALARRCFRNVIECSDDGRLKKMAVSALQRIDDIDRGQKQNAFDENESVKEATDEGFNT
jgi:type III secretion system low calcium response chaperone LcrH/SycD